MPLSSFSCCPSLPSNGRLRWRKPIATAFVGAWVLCPSSVCAAGTIRGGVRSFESPELTLNEQRGYYKGRELLTAGESLETTSLDVTQLDPRSKSHENEISIHPFTTNLLATDFPYQPKHQAENELSGAVSSHVAAYLSSVIDQPLLELGLVCAKFQQRAGPEIHWVVKCEGSAFFGDTPAPGEREVNEAVHGAFSDTAEVQFLEEMYPQYEMVREKREWDMERSVRKRQGNRQKQTNERERSKKKKKKKKKDKPKQPQKQTNKKKKSKKKKKKKKKEQKPKKQKPKKPPSKRPSSPKRPAKKPPNKPQMQEQLSPSKPSKLSGRDARWLSSHNDRRKKWHANNSKKYVPLKWSNALKAEAAVWARHLATQGRLYHDTNKGPYGENLAMNSGGGGQPTTGNVLSRWVEDEANLNFPANGHLTQVLWRATEWVGCADAHSGNTHVQVCRYARPGNCNMANYNTWLEPMLMDESPCGATCHPRDC